MSVYCHVMSALLGRFATKDSKHSRWNLSDYHSSGMNAGVLKYLMLSVVCYGAVSANVAVGVLLMNRPRVLCATVYHIFLLLRRSLKQSNVT